MRLAPTWTGLGALLRTRTIAHALPRSLALGLATVALVLTSAVTAQAASGTPIGNVDKVVATDGGIRITGWAWDPDTTAAVTVSIAAGGKTTQVKANTQRADVARVYSAAGTARGFSTVVPATAGTHDVCVTAGNVGAGSKKAFACRTVSVGSRPATAKTTVAAPSTSTRPNGSNTGVPAGVSLKRHDGDLVITKAGTVISGLDIRGFVDVRAPKVTIKNSIIRGRTPDGSIALVAVRSNAYSLTIEDSELAPVKASPYIDGLHGMNITARRLDISNVIDSVHIYGNNVLVEDSWLHDNAHFTKDPRWGGKPSHDDSVQIQRGSNVTLRGNSISGAYNAALMVTQDSGAVANLTVAGNWLDGGACVANIKKMKSAPTKVLLTDNVFGRNARYPNCGVKVPATYPLTMQRNVFDNGKSVPRTA